MSSTRSPCPACLGVQMTKLRPDPKLELELDHCERCGGIWFDQGEVDLLRQAHPQSLATRVKISEQAWVMQCHNCHAAMHRNLAKCPACGWRNVLQCPICQKDLAPVLREGLKLDVCRGCRGAWFDNVELAQIWNRSVTAVARRHGSQVPAEHGHAGYFFLDAFFWTLPFSGGGGSYSPTGTGVGEVVGAGDVAGGVIDGAGGADIGDAAGGLVDGAGEVAGDAFGWVADFLSGFDFF